MIRARIPSEHQEQAAFVRWFRLAHPGVLIFAIPNGAFLAGTVGKRAAQMARLKAEGLVEGIPDLFIPEWCVWIEMKRAKGGRVSPEQTEMAEALRGMNHLVIVAHGWEDAKVKLGALLDDPASGVAP
jgi:hypothetical protein